VNDRRAAVIRRELIQFDWYRHRLDAVPETDSYDWAHDLAAAIDRALTDSASDDVWTQEGNQ
jgi:hypothetical protein